MGRGVIGFFWGDKWIAFFNGFLTEYPDFKIVIVGGKGAFTGEVTNDLTGVVLRFDNGILKKGNNQ